MEGIYTIEEFKKDGEVFSPPQASGRYVILNGAVVWVLTIKRKRQSKQPLWALAITPLAKQPSPTSYDVIEVTLTYVFGEGSYRKYRRINSEN